MKLTPRQAEVLALIRRHLAETGFPPTRQEIADALGFRSSNAAEEHLRALARKGAIELLRGTSRGIRLLVDEPSLPRGLPLVGRVAAGSPILAEAHIEDHLELDGRLFRPLPDYLLRVQGASMRDAGILDGDLLAVHATPEAADGSIVVARLEDEVTVKQLRRHPPTPYRVSLVPANPDFQPIEVDLRRDSLVIEGLAVGLVRDLAVRATAVSL
ncbi:MAG: transcriptional repressor LexA [Pseudomonadota bacterium]